MFANISWPQLLIILVIVLAIFGTKRLRNIGSDLGSAVKGFRKGMEDDAEPESQEPEQLQADEVPVTDIDESEKENDPTQRPPGTNV